MIRAERAKPYRPSNQALVAFVLPYANFVARFGPAHRHMDKNDDEAGPSEYWAFRFPCGLSVFIDYEFGVPGGPGGQVYADSPDTEHVLQHVPVEDCINWRLDRDAPEVYREQFGERAIVLCPGDRPAGAVMGRTPSRDVASGNRDQLPDKPNLYGTVWTHMPKSELAAMFASRGWSMRKCTRVDYELRSDYAELVLEADDPLVLHGPVAEILRNAPRIAEVLRAAATKFCLECYARDRTMLRRIET
jgi:hypothetical protein